MKIAVFVLISWIACIGALFLGTGITLSQNTAHSNASALFIAAGVFIVSLYALFCAVLLYNQWKTTVTVVEPVPIDVSYTDNDAEE